MTSTKSRLLPLFFFAFLLPGTALSQARPKAAPAPPPGAAPGTYKWIVIFKKRSFDLTEYRKARYEGCDPETMNRIVRGLEEKARLDQADFTRFVEGRGGKVVLHLWLINGAVVDLPPAAVEAVRDWENTARLEPDRKVRPLIYRSTGSRNHNSDYANKVLGVTGKGVSIAVVDTGIDVDHAGSGRPHAAFFEKGKLGGGPGIKGTRILGAFGVSHINDTDDLDGHGTCVASVAAGWKWNRSSISDNGHAPDAGIVSYKITFGTSGYAFNSTILKAWQQVASDAARFHIAAANYSFSGDPDPTESVQQAMDSLCFNGNVLVCAAAGNSTSSTVDSPSCANGLAVGATWMDIKKVASFSSRGPLYRSGGRFYPDLCACGRNVTMALRDKEWGEEVASGTSFAGPQAAGAVLLVRSANKNLSALGAKAVILNTLEDVKAQNPGADRNTFGLGFLRDDLAVEAALGRGGHTLFKGRITYPAKTAKHTFPVTAGRSYAFTLAWNRVNFSSNTWDDLALEVRDSKGLLAFSDTPKNLYEKVTFLARKSGNVTILVEVKTMGALFLDYVVAAGPNTAGAPQSARVTYFGRGCPGTGRLTLVAPASCAHDPGNTYIDPPFANPDSRFQQIYLGSQTGGFLARWIGWRMDSTEPNVQKGCWVNLEVKMAGSDNSPDTIDSNFANNYSWKLPAVTVFSRKMVSLPDLVPGTFDPDKFDVKLPLDKPFRFDPAKAPNFLVEVLVGVNSWNHYIYYWMDGDMSFQKPYSVSTLVGLYRSSTSGYRQRGYGMVTGFGVETAFPYVKPEIRMREGWLGLPQTCSLSGAAPGAPALLFTGTKNTYWGGIPLPFDLAPLGAPGCRILCSAMLAQPARTGVTGKTALQWSLPKTPSMVGATFFHQWLVFDLKANGLGLVTSNAAGNTLGL